MSYAEQYEAEMWEGVIASDSGPLPASDDRWPDNDTGDEAEHAHDHDEDPEEEKDER